VTAAILAFTAFDVAKDFVFGAGMPPEEGVLVLLSFLITGFVLAFRNSHCINIGFLLQFIGATLLLRYGESYFVFHRSLREGIWPVCWSVAVLSGIYVAQRYYKA
jgi:hypothetical protein